MEKTFFIFLSLFLLSNYAEAQTRYEVGPIEIDTVDLGDGESLVEAGFIFYSWDFDKNEVTRYSGYASVAGDSLYPHASTSTYQGHIKNVMDNLIAVEYYAFESKLHPIGDSWKFDTINTALNTPVNYPFEQGKPFYFK